MQNVYWLTKFNTTKLHGFELRKMSRLYDDQEKQTKKILLFWFYCLKLRNLKLLVYQCISHRRKKKTSACLVLNKKRTWPVMRKSAGCLSQHFLKLETKYHGCWRVTFLGPFLLYQLRVPPPWTQPSDVDWDSSTLYCKCQYMTAI